MADIATLTIKVDASEVVAAKEALKSLEAQAARLTPPKPATLRDLALLSDDFFAFYGVMAMMRNFHEADLGELGVDEVLVLQAAFRCGTESASRLVSALRAKEPRS